MQIGRRIRSVRLHRRVEAASAEESHKLVVHLQAWLSAREHDELLSRKRAPRRQRHVDELRPREVIAALRVIDPLELGIADCSAL